MAKELGSAEDIVRAYINGSQGIDNAGRIEEALAMGLEGISVADRLGMSRSGGDQLRGQAAWRLQRSAAWRRLAGCSSSCSRTPRVLSSLGALALSRAGSRLSGESWIGRSVCSSGGGRWCTRSLILRLAAGNPAIESTVALPAAFPQFQKPNPDSCSTATTSRQCAVAVQPCRCRGGLSSSPNA
jgi:hypothetical protein